MFFAVPDCTPRNRPGVHLRPEVEPYAGWRQAPETSGPGVPQDGGLRSERGADGGDDARAAGGRVAGDVLGP